jgi:hypothetical protein
MTPYYLQRNSFNLGLDTHRPGQQRAGLTIEEEEDLLRGEVQFRVREIRRAIDRGVPAAAWRAQREDVDDLWQRLQEVQNQRLQALRSGQ